MDIDKLKKFEKLPPDVKRQLTLYMSKWKDKKNKPLLKMTSWLSLNMYGQNLLKDLITNK